MRTRKKLGVSLAAVNLAGILTALSFSLISGILAGLFGFLVGILGSTALIYRKEQH